MSQYIVKRLLLLPLLLVIFSIFAFVIIQAPPGDYITTYIADLAASGSAIDQAQIDALRERYGLDQPMYVQYLKWMKRLVTGDLGFSLDWQKPIKELIGERITLNRHPGSFYVRFYLAAGHTYRHHLGRQTVLIPRLFLHRLQLFWRGHADVYDRADPHVDRLFATSA